MKCLHGLTPATCAICNRAVLDRPTFKGGRLIEPDGPALRQDGDLRMRALANESSKRGTNWNPMRTQWGKDMLVRDIQELIKRGVF